MTPVTPTSDPFPSGAGAKPATESPSDTEHRSESAASHETLGATAAAAWEEAKEVAAGVAMKALEQMESAGDTAGECLEQGRVKMHDVTTAIEQFIRERPMTAVVAAVGIGLVIGATCNRR